MTEASRKHIGLDRKIELAWLDAVAAQAAAGAPPEEARAYAWRLLEGVLAGDTAHGARGKTITVLCRIWLAVPKQARELRDNALLLLPEAPASDRLAIHWAMMMAVYPFFLDISTNAGNLIAMNGDVTLSQTVRRMLIAWGDRSTLPRATQRILRSMVQWGVLRDDKIRGRYMPALTRKTLGDGAAELLLSGLLTGMGCGVSTQRLLSHPALFPFDLGLSSSQLGRSRRLKFHRQGDLTDIVELVHW